MLEQYFQHVWPLSAAEEEQPKQKSYIYMAS